MTASALVASSSRASSISAPESNINKDAETEAWNLLDALDWRTKPPTEMPTPNLSMTDAIFTTSPDWVQSQTRRSSNSNPEAPWEDIEIPNFPDLTITADGQRTSEPISQVEAEKEQDMLDLVTRDRLRELLDAPMGMVRFTEFIDEEGQPGSAALLRYYKDVRAQAILMQEAKAISQGLHITYFDQSNRSNAAFRGFSTSPSQCLPALSSAVLAMSSAEDEALDRLYAREFKRFISGKIAEQASACLGSFADHMGKGDLGEIYCLADPRQKDTPLVYVSDGFCELSEYPRSRLIGRNCRFLQGPGTDADAVLLLRNALRAGKEHTSLILNYTRTGKPFWNLLTMIPLKSAQGEIDYYLGAQINVTRALTSKDTYEALTGMAEKGRERSSVKSTRIEFSEDVLSAAEREAKAPVVLRKIIASQPPSSPIGLQYLPKSSSTNLQVPHDSLAPPSMDRRESHGKVQKWYSELKTRRSHTNLSRRGSSDSVNSANGAPIMQEVEASVREHMANFASVYSKIILFRASDRQITHITPPLLAYLGYPIKNAKDRLSPPLVGTDVLSLLADSSAASTKVTRQIAAKSISERSPHSFFTGLKLYDDGSKRSGEGDETTQAGAPFTRGLLHLTPVKDIKDEVVSYVLVVG